MGLIRSLARKVLGRSTPAPESKPAPTPATSVSLAGVTEEESEKFSNLERGAQELKERIDAGETVLLVDVREPNELATGIIPGAISIPLGQLPERWQEVKDANEVVVYCAAGMRSYQGTRFLREKGIQNATSMEGGIKAWADIGGKVVPR